MKPTYYISAEQLTIAQVAAIAKQESTLGLSEFSQERIESCRSYLEKKLDTSDTLFYGINTGFGSLCNVRILPETLCQLQNNLVQSHAVGLGEEVPLEIVRLMLFFKIKSLSYGHSGVRLETVNRLIDFYNNDILPIIYQMGSLGASGDLAPLAHLALPLIGLGKVHFKGKESNTNEIYQHFNWSPLILREKEGLALLNGTQFSTAYGAWCLLEGKRLLKLANLCAAISMDGFFCLTTPFEACIHELRPHPGQQKTAAAIRRWLTNSEIAKLEKRHVQDPYSFRCVPQVHGASWDAIAHVEQTITIEMNAVTDNPNIFPKTDKILSGGNFHAQHLALTLDYLAIALAELGNISERRVFQLLSGLRDLPVFLTRWAGLHSGMMITQYTAASIVSQNKQYCTPASVDSIVSSNGQEDHVSMAANAATKAWRVIKNLERLLAIEFMVGMQALEFRKPLSSSPAIENLRLAYRKVVPMLKEDRILSSDIQTTLAFLSNVVDFKQIP